MSAYLFIIAEIPMKFVIPHDEFILIGNSSGIHIEKFMHPCKACVFFIFCDIVIMRQKR
ncbi:hypothetical protein MBAV_004991 [Candidatus Magnetobacterium bavaricum]|uniref:Uncharacterized protein n=1 Tax=Candidatus Magnetobacterium bavaricum TaxID=29290 RepID=A0A0F3GQ92_9BACT|nr:hypothetical protein MBAV_004991 [Candidatus Magnetobacterium bavaricum]